MPVRNVLALILLLLLAAASPAHGRDYSLDGAQITVEVGSDGLVQVTESISYTFEGNFREVFRKVYPPPGGSVGNFKIQCSGQPCDGRVDRIQGGYELVGVLPQPTPDRITFKVAYDFKRGLKVYDDVSELHFKLWGEEWEKSLAGLKATIHLPPEAESNIEYWLHPESLASAHGLQGTTIVVETGKIPSNQWFEIRAVYPRIENPDPDLVSVINGLGWDRILEVENEYKRKQKRAENLHLTAWFLATVAIGIPLFIYHKFGREPKINYLALQRFGCDDHGPCLQEVHRVEGYEE
jgi:uncharacterized membrane protein